MPDLIERSATELAGLVHAGDVSPREVVAAHLERIDQANPELNAIVTMRADEALADAEALGRAIRAEGRSFPLAGVPFTVKDLIATGGVRTTAGTRFLQDFVPAADATAVRRLREAGAILLGKTNCPEWGMFPYTRNDLFGETRVDNQIQHFQVLGKGHELARPPGEWNTYEITCKGKTITVRVNGSVATTWDDCRVPRGHVGMQAEFFVIAFRNLKFKELP